MPFGQTTLKKIAHSIRLRQREFIILIIYPITILVGQIIYHTSPEIINNYYTNKHNLLNILFVKKGWFWTCLIYLYLVYQHGKSITKALVRLSIMTIWWICFTQWFFGLPLMDRIFKWTGGICEYDIEASGVLEDIGSSVCRQVKGHWIGGHDPSGHVFLLVLGSLVLWFEVLDVELVKELELVIGEVKRSKGVFSKVKVLIQSSLVLSLLLLWLWWWMLMITSIHFHSFIEQMSGLIAGCLGLFVYTIPRML